MYSQLMKDGFKKQMNAQNRSKHILTCAAEILCVCMWGMHVKDRGERQREREAAPAVVSTLSFFPHLSAHFWFTNDQYILTDTSTTLLLCTIHS